MARQAAAVLGVCGAAAAAVYVALGTEPWPAESHAAAVKLTGVDAGLNTVNWSGAFWNSRTRMLWLACNSGYFWALAEDGAGGFEVATNSAGAKAKWTPGGDLEGVCQAALDEQVAFLLDENGWIREFDVSQYGVVSQNRNWDIRAYCPEVGGAGPEGIAFVPDEWLRREGFRDSTGALYVSTNGMGGLVFVGHQDGGQVHVFDLNRVGGGCGYIGEYETGRGETAGLEFDRSTGMLYVWHNTGINYLEMTELGSEEEAGGGRRVRALAEYAGPRSGNLEGFAMTPRAETQDWCFVTDDDNSGGEAVMWYRAFRPSEDTDQDGLWDGWELWHFGSVGVADGRGDADGDGMNDADERGAGTDPTNRESALMMGAPALGSGGVRVCWRSVSGRVYAVEEAAVCAGGSGTVVRAGIPAVGSVTCSTVGAVRATGGAFYRVTVEDDGE